MLFLFLCGYLLLLDFFKQLTILTYFFTKYII